MQAKGLLRDKGGAATDPLLSSSSFSLSTDDRPYHGSGAAAAAGFPPEGFSSSYGDDDDGNDDEAHPSGRAIRTLLVSKDSEATMVARAIGWEVLRRRSAYRRKAAATAAHHHRLPISSSSEGKAMQAPALSRSILVASLRMGFGDAMLNSVLAVALAQRRVAEEIGGQLVVVPRSVRMREAGRTFNMAEWQLFFI
jgi:hypothetical protein